jgi:transposase
MMIIGCDFHPSWQQVSWLDTKTGETGEQKLVHAEGQAKTFYQQLTAPALIGMEATGNSQWFIELVQELGHVILIGDAAQIRASYVRKQKDGQAGRGAHAEAAAGKTFPHVVDSRPGRARSAATDLASA